MPFVRRWCFFLWTIIDFLCRQLIQRNIFNFHSFNDSFITQRKTLFTGFCKNLLHLGNIYSIRKFSDEVYIANPLIDWALRKSSNTKLKFICYQSEFSAVKICHLKRWMKHEQKISWSMVSIERIGSISVTLWLFFRSSKRICL